MFRMSKVVGLALFGFLLVVCTVTSAQPNKDDEKKPEKGKFGPGAGMRNNRPQPGKIFSTFVVTQLKLTEEQAKQLEAMQKEIDEKLEKMLTDDQKAKLKELATARPGMGGRGPGGRPKDKNKDETKDEKKDN